MIGSAIKPLAVPFAYRVDGAPVTVRVVALPVQLNVSRVKVTWRADVIVYATVIVGDVLHPVTVPVYDPLAKLAVQSVPSARHTLLPPTVTAVAARVATVVVPVNVGDALRTLEPVPVLVVTPVPPRATASVPAVMSPASRPVSPDPSPVTVVAATVAAVTVPVKVGDALSTTLPVPVLVVTPVPPRATGSVPLVRIPASRTLVPLTVTFVADKAIESIVVPVRST